MQFDMSNIFKMDLGQLELHHSIMVNEILTNTIGSILHT